MAFTLQIDESAPDFDLPAVDGNQRTLASYADADALVIVFTCNHCPSAIGVEDRINDLYATYQPKGVELIVEI